MKTASLLLVACALLVGCGDPPPPPVEEPQQNLQTISGTVVFREKIGLTPESRLEVMLLDVSLADVPSVEIARSDSDNPGQSPIGFTIEYDADLIDESHSYSIRANVFDRGRLIMVSDTVNRVLTGTTQSDVRILVTRVARPQSAQPPESGLD